MAKSEKLPALSWKGVILSIIVIAVFGFIAIKSTFEYIYCKELQTAINKGIVVEADIVYLRHNVSGLNGSTYRIMYRYVDDDGIVYEGSCGSGDYRDEEEARKRIGQKVEIYIGGLSKVGARPLCWAVCYGSEVSVRDEIIVMSVFYSAIIIYIALVILYCLIFYDKLPKLKNKKIRDE